MKRFAIYVACQYPPVEFIAVGVDAAIETLAKMRANNPGRVVLCAAEDAECDPHRGLSADEMEMLS